MQVNYRIWGRRLGITRTQLLDPYINAWAGAVILRLYLSLTLSLLGGHRPVSFG